MSLTLTAWLLVACVLVVASFRRPVFALCFYMQTFLLAPPSWWWGGPIAGYRWNLAAALLCVVTALARRREDQGQPSPATASTATAVALALALNATFVHFLVAPYPAISFPRYELYLKVIALFFVIRATVRDETDLRIAIWAITLGSAYIGYEATINDRGSFQGGRLEGIGASGVNNSNELASLMVTVLPLAGGLFMTGSRREKILAALCAPLILNLIVLANSRGGFLGLMAAGLAFILVVDRASRWRALKAFALGGVALFVLLGDPEILDRFKTTFSGSEERDTSAASRVVFWRAAMHMIADYPLGQGGDAFARIYSTEYIQALGWDDENRAVHNGYLSEATEWGLQGLALKLLLVGVVAAGLRGALRRARPFAAGATLPAVCACLYAGLAGLLVTAVFGEYFRAEWLIWMLALMLVSHRLLAASTVPAAADREVEPRATVPATAVAPHLPARGGAR